tara:strand:- start:163 stop:783 length:621 start_codon:yes stop_codon:yes gene_type:complete
MLLDLEKLKEEFNLNITGVMQIGAHYGEEYNDYVKLFGEIPIIMWEPSIENLKVLREKYGEKENLTIINKAVGSFECTADMFVESANRGASNSVLEPALHKYQYPHIQFNQREQIKIYPLDKWECAPVFNFMNIDVQGFEMHVFMGATKTLNNVDYIMTEVNRAEVYKNCAQIDEIDWFLDKYKFKRVKTTWDGEIWGDAFYIKQK